MLDFSPNTILFKNKEAFVAFLKELGSNPKNWKPTRFRCIEDIEGFFGIGFGDALEIEDGNANFDNIISVDVTRQPQEYPCLLVISSLECIRSGVGSGQINFAIEPVYLYKSNFEDV